MTAGPNPGSTMARVPSPGVRNGGRKVRKNIGILGLRSFSAIPRQTIRPAGCGLAACSVSPPTPLSVPQAIHMRYATPANFTVWKRTAEECRIAARPATATAIWRMVASVQPTEAQNPPRIPCASATESV